MLCVTLGSLSSAEASYSRALGKKLDTRSARRLGRGKIKARGELPPFPSSHRSPRSRFLSPALPLSFFLSLVFTNRSLCGGESSWLESYTCKY